MPMSNEIVSSVNGQFEDKPSKKWQSHRPKRFLRWPVQILILHTCSVRSVFDSQGGAVVIHQCLEGLQRALYAFFIYFPLMPLS
jgi:hypothetical protein